MLVLALEAVILITLIKMFTDNEVGFWTPLFIALVSAIATAALGQFLIPALGLWGIPISVILSALILAGLLTVVFGTELKQSMIIGVVFVCAHIAIHVAFYFMFRT